MTDHPDDTGYSKTPGNARLPPHAPPSLNDDPDDGLDLRIRRVPFPAIMLAAGILWILAGASYLSLFALLWLIAVPFEARSLWIILGAFFFTKDGIVLLRGKFRDPLMDGLISIGLSVIFIAQGVYEMNTTGSIGGLIFAVFFCAVFLIPGVLVLIGRKQYRAWQQEQEA